MPNTDIAVVVLAAGEGTRMRSSKPKVLHELAGRSLLGHAVSAAAGLDPGHLLVVIGHGREQVAAHLADLSARTATPITPVVQDKQLGTGHAVRCAIAELPAQFSGTVLVSYADVPLLDTATLRLLAESHAAAGNAITMLTTNLDDPSGYGRVLRDPTGAVTAVVEHADATGEQRAITEINSGVYAFDAKVLTDALPRIASHNAQGELYLTDVLAVASSDGRPVGAVDCADRWLVTGVNDRAQLAEAGAELNRRLTRRAMLAGVTMIDPATTWLDVDVELGRDIVLAPNVQLHGRCVIGEGARIGPDCTLTDVVVGAGASVVRTHGSSSEIGDGATVGPFAYLRPDSKLGAGGKIGTFVETKNAEIGAGTKVPHLSYVGDATIGEHTNIGAASVFVNYDGVRKSRTVVGSHARTGSDNMFIAPVTIGDGAYSGAGAVIREDVPPGALAVSASQQRNIEGWVARKRPGTAADEAARKAQRRSSNAGSESEG
jgi:bifunctional UDP-N-acetylglucosamine pyrophosphorylase / glucosamine-1-phosphate N-acetyltransferase